MYSIFEFAVSAAHGDFLPIEVSAQGVDGLVRKFAKAYMKDQECERDARRYWF